MNRFLNNTAILALSAALALPHGGFAQQADAPVADSEVSTDADAELLKKKLEEEAEAARVAAEEAEAAAAAQAEAERVAEEQAQAAAEAEAAKVAAEQAEAAAAAEAERLAAEQAEAERVAAEQAEAERAAAEQAEAERLAAEEAEAERLATEQAEAERLAAEQAEAERLAAEQAEVEAAQAEAEAAAADAETAVPEEAPETAQEQSDEPQTDTGEVAAEQPAEAPVTDEVAEQPEAGPETEAQTADQLEAAPADAAAPTEQVQTEPAEATETAEQVETAPAEDTETTQQVETAPEDNTATNEQVETAPAESAAVEQAADEPATQPETEVVDEAVQAAAAEERQAEAVESAAITGDAEAATVETEAVTEDTSRASTEEFDPAPQATAGNDGLSKFEKALLLGLGAVVVGSVLKNGDKVVSNSGDRVVVQGDEGLRVLKNDNELMRRPGADVRTETFNDGSTRTIVTRPNGNRVVTIAAPDGRVIQRLVFRPDGSEVVLIDDTEQVAPVDLAFLPEPAPTRPNARLDDELALRVALQQRSQSEIGRNFSLAQIRGLRSVRDLAPAIELDALTFASGSAAIDPAQAEALVALGRAITGVIQTTPEAVFLIEGHTDAVGAEAYNLALSDRRAETVALALTEYFDVPPENLITQGYGESALKVATQVAEQANRRAVVRNITPLLR